MTSPETGAMGSLGESSEQVSGQVSDSGSDQVSNSWFDKVPAEFKENKSLTALKDKGFDDFIKDYVNKDGAIGRKGVLLPKEGDEADKQRFYRELGVPESLEGYQNVEVEIPEGIEDMVDTSRLDMFKEVAHKYNLTDEQYRGVVAEVMAKEIGGIKDYKEAQVAKANEAKTALRNEWGERTDERIANAQKVIDSFADEKSVEFFNANNKDVGLIRFLDNIASKISNDTLKSDTAAPTVSKEQAQIRMAEILKSDDYWLNIPTPGAKSIRQEYQELAKIVG